MTQPGEDGSFDERLRAARSRQGLATGGLSTGGLDPVDQAATSAAGSAWGVGARVGVELVAALAVGLGIGWGLDRWLHTLPLFLVIFVLLGGAAGIVNVWRMMAPRG